MLKAIFNLLKSVVMSAILLYAYNKFAISINAIIPINIINVLLVSIFKFPAMVGLVLFNFIVF